MVSADQQPAEEMADQAVGRQGHEPGDQDDICGPPGWTEGKRHLTAVSWLSGLSMSGMAPPLVSGGRPHNRARLPCAAGRALRRGPTPGKQERPMAKIKVKNPGRRARRRRDDPDHLAMDPRAADPALPRRRPALFRPQHREPRRDRRQGDGRSGRSDQAVWRRRQMRDHHARRGAGRGIRPQEDVEVAQRHHPQHPQRRRLPRADRDFQHPAPDPRLDRPDRRRPPCLRRPV